MKKDVLIKMTCLSATLILLSTITLILSNFKGEKPNDFSSENSYFNSIPKEENHFESGESNGNPLSDADKITETVALKIAAKYINTENAQIEKTKKEEIDTFVVENEFGTANISESGGSLVSFSKDDEDEIKNFSDQQCFDKANEFMKNYYSASFTPRYFESGEGECFMVFTSKNGGTLCNPDKIEITVSKKSGEIIYFDASDFLVNFKNRTLRAPEFSKEDAQKHLEKDLIVEQVNQVVIKTKNGEEMCYEFICETDAKEKKLVYLNVYSLNLEEEIILPKDQKGIFLK